MPGAKSAMTWAPWTAPRLACGTAMAPASSRPAGASICGARAAGAMPRRVWLATIAGVLRAKGHLVSTASLIEAERLARALAAIRERPKPGFEELRDAAVAALFNGEADPVGDWSRPSCCSAPMSAKFRPTCRWRR